MFVDKQEAYVQLICDTYPDLAIEKVSLNDRGQYNDILIINDDLIFRFPKYAEAIRQLETESIILQGIQSYVTLPIPNPIYKSEETQAVGKVFMSYHMIHGEPLWRETLLAINDEATVQALAIQLGTFLKTLHSVPVKSAFDVELPVVSSYAEWSDMYARIRQKLFPYMRPEARRSVENHFEQFLNDAHNFAFHLVLIHGDFGSSNILFDANLQRIRGVIDFGSAGLGDPAIDFASLTGPFGYGEAFLLRMCSVYPTVTSLLERARFYSGTFALQEALFGIENGDREAFESGIESYV